MKTLTPYQQAISAVDRCKQIREDLDGLDAKHDPKQVRGLVLEFQWTVKRIISICNSYLDKEIQDNYSEEIETRVKVEQILEQYKSINDQIN